MSGSSHPAFSDLPRWLLDSLGEGVSIADAEGRIVYSNKAADRILGVPSTDRPPADWADYYGIFMADGRTRFSTEHYPLVRALRGESTNEVEMVVRNRANPWEVRISVTGRPLVDGAGQVVGATVVFRDVTALSSAQFELAETNEELRRVQRLKDELSTFVIHDLNGPLTGILALTEMLLLDNPADPLRASLVDLRDLAHNLHGIVVDLLDLKVSEDGMLRPEREDLEVDGVLADVHAAVAPRAMLEGKRVALVPGGATGLRVRADPDLLRRTLQNLVDNGIRYAPRGGTIEVCAAPGPDHTVRITVSDQGPGIPAAFRERVFEKYARIERDQPISNRQSRGLGLRFCRVATEAQGGRVWVEDVEPTGARFCVELRAAR